MAADLTHTKCMLQCAREMATAGIEYTHFALGQGTHCYCGTGDPDDATKAADSLLPTSLRVYE